MARPYKSGLPYFPVQTNFMSDKKIVKLRRKYGPTGLMIYFEVLFNVYREGYYLKISLEDLADNIVDDFRSDKWVSKDDVVAILHLFSELDLIDKSLAEKGIITSKAIQKQYILSTKRRSNAKVDEYCLLSEKDKIELSTFLTCSAKVESVSRNAIIVDNNPSSSDINADINSQSKSKRESKSKSQREVDKQDEEDKFDKAIDKLPFEVDYFTKLLIHNGTVSLYDEDLGKYPALFASFTPHYEFDDIIRAVRYVSNYIKHPSNQIDDKFCFIKQALINNIDWLSREDERAKESEEWLKFLKEYEDGHHQ